MEEVTTHTEGASPDADHGEQQSLGIVVERAPRRRYEWRLDDRTKEIGRRGLAEARAALEAAVRRSAA